MSLCCGCYREDESADALNDVRTVVRLDDDVQVHYDPLVVLVIAATSHLLHTQPTPCSISTTTDSACSEPTPPPQPFYGPFSRTTRVSRCQKKTSGLYGAREDQQRQTQSIQLGATPSGLTSAHFHHPPIFFRPDALPAAQPTVSKH